MQLNDETWIFSPAALQPKQLSLFEKLQCDGNYTVHETGIGRVWIEDNPAELIIVHVAEKRRYGFDDVPEDVPFSIGLGLKAGGMA